MNDCFPEAMNFVWAPNNDGQPFHVSANDPGAATAWGVTFATWSWWQQAHHGLASLEAFSSLDRTGFLPLYRSMFWNACCCGSLGVIGIQVFDAAVNCGPGHAVRFLQRVLAVTQDGEIGPLTVAAAQRTNQRALARGLCAQREEFYAALPEANYFGRGWNERAERCREVVLSLLGPGE